MTHHVKIQYSHPETKPPVYVAGDWNNWEPQEMIVSKSRTDDGHLIFLQDCNLEPGQHQYKFRLGSGDWWVLDETAETG
jgi:hypothetical protein